MRTADNQQQRQRTLSGRLHYAAFLLMLAATTVLSETPEQASQVDYCKASPLIESQRDQLVDRMEDRLGTSPADRATAALTLAGYDIAAASPNDRSCEKAFEKGRKDFDRQLRKQLRRVQGGAGDADSSDPAIQAVQQQLRDAYIADQAARLAYIELRTDDRQGADFWAQRLAMANAIVLDGVNTALLETLLMDYDWIDSERFGNRIASHAWLIAQHADANPEFQKAVLLRMEPYLATGGVRQRDYAYLYDRVAVNTGGLQRYGTQPLEECNPDGSLSPKPLEDPDRVDVRRAELGMEPMSDAMADMATRRC